jgi:hypothetical protein
MRKEDILKLLPTQIIPPGCTASSPGILGGHHPKLEIVKHLNGSSHDR